MRVVKTLAVLLAVAGLSAAPALAQSQTDGQTTEKTATDSTKDQGTQQEQKQAE